MNAAPRLSESLAKPVMPKPSKKRAHKKRRAELKKQARAPGTQKGYLCCDERVGSETKIKKYFEKSFHRTRASLRQ